MTLGDQQKCAGDKVVRLNKRLRRDEEQLLEELYKNDFSGEMRIIHYMGVDVFTERSARFPLILDVSVIISIIPEPSNFELSE